MPALGLLVWLVLKGLKREGLTIPCLAALALLASAWAGRMPTLTAAPGWPVIDPVGWWQGRWGMGTPIDGGALPATIPYALLVLLLWPMDAVAIRTMQTQRDAERSTNTAIDLQASFRVIACRNLVGALLGGAQTAAVWRSFLIPLARAGRPVQGAALLLSLGVLGVALLGFPIDLAVHPPLVWLVLLFGVFVPLLEAGTRLLLRVPQKTDLVPVASLVAMGMLLGPLWGWGIGLLVEWLMKRRATPPSPVT